MTHCSLETVFASIQLAKNWVYNQLFEDSLENNIPNAQLSLKKYILL